MAEGHDHEIVTALKTHPKGIPCQFEIELCVITGIQV